MSVSLPKRKLVTCVLSARHYHQRRDACERTWFSSLTASEGVEAVFVLGGGRSLRQSYRAGHMLTVPCADDYQSLPQKVYWFLRWALETFDFQWIFKCDDDTYVHVRRLLAYDIGQHDYLGSDVGGYASGGAGYFLSAAAARKLGPDLRRRITGAEDLIVGEALRKHGYALRSTRLLAPYFDEGRYPAPSNHLITGHHVTPGKMLEIHAALESSAAIDAGAPFHICDWETGWGVLGLKGEIGHEVDGAKIIRPPDFGIDWSRYELLSGHVDCRIELQVQRPLGLFGFMERHSWNTTTSPVTFTLDGHSIGVLVGPDTRTTEHRLTPGRHVLRMCTPGDKTRRYPVWAVRELCSTDSFRIVIPTSNAYAAVLAGTLKLLDRYWPEHPAVDVVHHEDGPSNVQVRSFFAGRQAEVTWCEAMASYLSEANTDELVLLLLDDYGLCQPVDTQRVKVARSLMTEDLSIGAFFLTWMQVPASTPYADRQEVMVWPRWSYSVHTQAALWRRTSLLRAVRRVGRRSIFAFELEASKLFNERDFEWERHVSFRLPPPPVPSLFLDTCDKAHWPIAYHNLCHQGRRDPRHHDFLRAHGIEVA